MTLLKKEQQESFESAKICDVLKGKFENRYSKNKKYREVRDNCHYTREDWGAAHRRCNLKNKNPYIFHNGSNYDFHFITKESVEEFWK